MQCIASSQKFKWARSPPSAHSGLVLVRPVLLFLVGVDKPAKCPVLLAPIDVRQVVEFGFLAQLQVVLQMLFAQFAPLDRRTNRTTRFAAMTAVGIPAVPCKCADVGKGLIDSLTSAKHPQFAHARHVYQQATMPEHDQLASRGGVTPLTRMADLAGFERAATQQTVDERCLANARRTEEAVGLAGRHELANLIDARARHIADADDLRVYPHESDPADQPLQFFRTDQIRLRQKHHGLDMAVPDHHEVALQPSDIEIEVAGLHDERHVDVCRNHLELDVAAGGFAPEEGSAWQQVVNAGLRAGIAVVHAHPIAHAWKFGGGLGEVEEFAGQFGWHLAVLAPDQVSPPVNRGDPGDGQIGPTQFAGFVRQPGIQTKFTEFHLGSLADTDVPAKPARPGRLICLANDRLNPRPNALIDRTSPTVRFRCTAEVRPAPWQTVNVNVSFRES